MLRIVDTVLAILFPVHVPMARMVPASQFAGTLPSHRQWFKKKSVLWFNGYPGVPKLPLVQRLRAAPSALAPVATFTPDEGGDEETGEDPEPLCRKSY